MAMDEQQDAATGRVLDLLFPHRGEPGHIHYHINASGMGVVAAVLVAIVMLVINVMQGRDIVRHDASIEKMEAVQRAANDKMEMKYERMQDHLSAIYAQAPHLKPQPEKSSP